MSYIKFFYYLFLFNLPCFVAAEKYVIKALTSTVGNAKTTSPIYLLMKGNIGQLKEFPLKNPINRDSDVFERGSENIYEVEKPNIGIVCCLRVRHFGTDGWHLIQISVKNTKIHSFSEIVFRFNTLIDNFGTESRSFKVNGGWSDWSSWSLLGETCNENTLVYRNRSCNAPTPGCNGSYCKGISEQKLPCMSLNESRHINDSKGPSALAVNPGISTFKHTPTENKQPSASKLTSLEMQEESFPRIFYVGSVTAITTLILAVIITVIVVLKFGKALRNLAGKSYYVRYTDDKNADNMDLNDDKQEV